MTTLKELKTTAAELKIEGRSKMNQAELAAAIAEAQASADPVMAVPVESVKTIKRKVSTNRRDETGAVIRKGRNLSGNTPWKAKHYYYDASLTDPAALEAAPNQVKLILKYMQSAEITESSSALRGFHIVEGAKRAGVLSSRIPSANLFAYYRRLMEALGLIYVG